MDPIDIIIGADVQEGLTLAKHPRTRLSDYDWRAEIRSAPGAAGGPVSALTLDDGGIVIADDLGGELTLVWGHAATAAMEAGRYVLDLRAVNLTTGVVEYTDTVPVIVREKVTQPGS